VIALALLLSAGLHAARRAGARAVNDPRVQQALAQLENARGKHDEVRYAWFPSITTNAFVGGPTPEHYLHDGAYAKNPTDSGA